MPAVPENSGLLTGILDSDSVEDLESVEVSQERDIESPESTSQVIISRCVYYVYISCFLRQDILYVY